MKIQQTNDQGRKSRINGQLAQDFLQKQGVSCVLEVMAWRGRIFAWRIRQIGLAGSRPISRVLSRAIIHLRRASPRACSDLPGSRADHTLTLPYLVLLRAGFTLPLLLPAARCALTAPFHPCRSAGSRLRRSVFCGTFRRLAPPKRYLAPCPAEPGLSSTP